MITRDHLIASTKRNLTVRAILTLVPIALLFLLSYVSDIKALVVYKSIVTMRYSIFFALEGYLGVKIFRYIKILTDADYCDLVLTQRNDERITYIGLKTNAIVVKILIYVIGIGLIIFGFINSYVFYTLLGILAVIIIIYLSAYVYFHKKY